MINRHNAANPARFVTAWLKNPYMLLTLTTIFWAGNTIAGRLAIGNVSPMGMTCFRWLISFALMSVHRTERSGSQGNPDGRDQLGLDSLRVLPEQSGISAKESQKDWRQDGNSLLLRGPV